jgi:signal transduction histidine kinase
MIANVQKSETLDPTFSSVAKDLAQLQINLKATHFRASRTAVNSSDVVQAANEIRSQIDNAIRPLSRRLWVSSIYEFPRIRLIPVFLEAMRTLKFPLAPVIVIFAITTTFNYSVTFGPRIGFARALGGTAVLLACEILRRRLHLTIPALNVLYLFSIGFIVNLVSTLTTSAIEFKKYLGFYLALSPEVGSLILIISVISLAAADRTEILNNLRSQVINEQAQQLKDQSEIQGAQLASYLHNSLQSELSAIALQLEFASQNPRSGDIEEILERLNAIVQRSLSEDFLNYLEMPRERFDRIISSWDGIVLIRHQIEPAIFMDPIRATLFIQLIQEGIANAVRRGNASLVEIESQYDSEVLKVGIWNDGDFDTTSKAGLGHEWIERLAVSDWSIQSSGQGTKLEVEF